MSSGKKKKTISDQINEILKPKELAEETDETEARFEEFTEYTDVGNQLSDIRKQTAKHLSELDSKYKGKLVTRKELEQEDDESSDNSNSEEENDYATDSDDGEKESEDQAFESGEEEEDSNQSSEDDGDKSDFDDDFNLSHFANLQAETSASGAIPEKTEMLKDSTLSEDIKKGVCVQNQLKIWEKLLEVRIKSQKMLISANSMPDFDAHLELSTMKDSTFSEKVEKTCDGIYGLLDNLLEIQETLIKR